MDSARTGILYALAAYLWWGLSPVFWKLLAAVPATELVAHRVLWSAPLLAAWLLLRRRAGEVMAAVASGRVLAVLAVTTVLIAINWCTYIWAVNNAHIVEASLGYFINPLVTVLLGLVVLRERLSRAQVWALALAAAGVLLLTLRLGRVPWIALVLAVSFGLYGLLRKTVAAAPVPGLLVEIALLVPVAALYLGALGADGAGAFGHTGLGTDLLLASSGAITAAPLVWFTHGARRLPLTTLGFLQYLAPSLQFALGVAVYREPFPASHWLAYGLIWTGLAVFTVDRQRRLRPAGRAQPPVPESAESVDG